MTPGPIETLFYSSPDVRVGSFSCPVAHPEFRVAGPIEGYSVVFPRTAVWIQHEGQKPFVADPLVVTVYNKAQPYVRLPLAPDGDRVDWFSVGQPLAAAIAAEVDPASTEQPTRPFRTALAPCDAALYRRQRLLHCAVQQGSLTSLAVEQEVVLLIAAVLRTGVTNARPAKPPSQSAQRDLVEAAKAELARDLSTTPRLRDLAARVHASPYHLCHVFRRWCGMTLHEYLIDLRIRAALEGLAEPPLDLSRLAHRLGFSSHSHFTAAFKRRMGVPPSHIRSKLLRESAEAGEGLARRTA